MKISDIFLEKNFIKTLKECSFDDSNNEYLSESSYKVIDFDKVTEEYCKQLPSHRQSMRSNDALVRINDVEFYLIEFKNGMLNGRKLKHRLEAEKIKVKIYDSCLLLSDLDDFSLEDVKTKFSYILVYNEQKNNFNGGYKVGGITDGNARVALGNALMNLSGENYIQLGLQRFKDYLFKDVYTVSEIAFHEKFVENWELKEY